MSVLVVTDDADDDIGIVDFNRNPNEYLYKQLKELDYDCSSSTRSFSFVESSSSILVQSNQTYRQHRQRRRCRTQQCLVQHLLTYMLTLLILTNQLHWPLLILSFSSIKILPTHATSTATTTRTKTTTTTFMKRPASAPSNARVISKSDEDICRPINGLHIDRICSKTCRARKNPYERKSNKFNTLTIDDLGYLPFCTNFLNQSLAKETFLNDTTELECRTILKGIIESDEEARRATNVFATYMESIDSASPENRYSIISADCQKAYRTWACSVNIPFFYKNQLVPPCHTICDEVERVCPTFRPSDREPLFAGQPLFFCTGGIVPNSDYGRRPHCFDICHLNHGSLQRPSSPLLTNQSHASSLDTFVEDLVTTPTCFDIQPLSSSSSSSSEISFEPNSSPNATNTSLSSSSSSSANIPTSLSSLSIIYPLIMLVFQAKCS